MIPGGLNHILLGAIRSDPSQLFANGEDGAWYDFSDLSAFWQDEGGTTPISADAQTVARADDKSGNSNNITQSSASKEPEYDNDLSSRIICDGTDDELEATVIGSSSVNSELWIFFAGRATGTTNVGFAGFHEPRQTAASVAFQTFRIDPNRVIVRTGTGTTGDNASISVTVTSDCVITARVRQSDRDFSVWKDGTLVSSTTVPGTSWFPSSFVLSIGEATATDTSNEPAHQPGHCAGFIYVNGAVSDSERISVEDWLRNKL